MQCFDCGRDAGHDDICISCESDFQDRKRYLHYVWFNSGLNDDDASAAVGDFQKIPAADQKRVVRAYVTRFGGWRP